MKRLALIAVLLWLPIVAWIVLSMNTQRVVEPMPFQGQANPVNAQLSSLIERGRAALTDTRRALVPSYGEQPAVLALRSTSSSSRADARLTDSLEGEPEPQRQVSMIYTAPGFARAMIDGQYVAIGHRLVDGGRVVRIDSNRVVVRDRTGDHVLRLDNPLSSGLNGQTRPARERH